jgi:hypothetical protein
MLELVCTGLAKLSKHLKEMKKVPWPLDITTLTPSDMKQNKENMCPFSILQCRQIEELGTNN